MLNELDVLKDVSERLERAGIAYMLTGSVAMNYYAQPRMTRDIDLVVALAPEDGERVRQIFEPDYVRPGGRPGTGLEQRGDVQFGAHRERSEGGRDRAQERRLSASGICSAPADRTGRVSCLDRQQGRFNFVEASMGEGLAFGITVTRRTQLAYHGRGSRLPASLGAAPWNSAITGGMPA